MGKTMGETIGVYICNYNGKDYTVNCLKSLFKQTLCSFDVYVVDNASTDGTVECVRSQFEQVTIIQNPENLGGAGGFDRGLKDSIEKKYDYIMLLDNDIILEEHLVENMFKYMEENTDVGIVGSKVMIMDMPDTIQDYGNYLNFSKYKEENAYCLQLDSDAMPEINECDYVPTCCVMIRREALLEGGTMPVENFIYYDDIELSHKMKLKGWRVVALGGAKVWHKGGFRKTVKNTFARYYFLRNRLHFFSKYVDEAYVDDFIEVALTDVFRLVYGFNNKQIPELLDTIMYAFDDYLHCVRGKADDYKIMNLRDILIPYKKCFLGKKTVSMIVDRNEVDGTDDKIVAVITYLLINAKEANKDIEFLIDWRDGEEEFKRLKKRIISQEEKFGDVKKLPEFNYSKDESGELCFVLCNHVSNAEENILPKIYVDQYMNCISSIEEYKYFTNMAEAEKLFKNMYRPMMKKVIEKIKG